MNIKVENKFFNALRFSEGIEPFCASIISRTKPESEKLLSQSNVAALIRKLPINHFRNSKELLRTRVINVVPDVVFFC